MFTTPPAPYFKGVSRGRVARGHPACWRMLIARWRTTVDNNVIAAVARSTIGNGTRSWRDPYQDRRIGYALSATIILRDMVLHGTKRDDSLGGEKYGYWRDEGSTADHERGNLYRNLWMASLLRVDKER